MDTPEYRESNAQGLQGILRTGNSSPLTVIEECTLFKENYSSVVLTDVTFNKKISFTSCFFDERLFFKDCTFNDNVGFADCTFNKSLVFENCKFNQLLEFVNCSHDKFQLVGGTYNEIKFKGTIKESRIGENTIYFEKGNFKLIEFKTKEVYSSLEFNESTIQDLLLIGALVRGSLSFDKNLSIEDLMLESCDFHQRVDFKKAKVKSLYIRKINFYEQVVIDKMFVCKSLTFSGIHSHRNISVEYDDNINSLDIQDCRFDGDFNLYRSGENHDNKSDINFSLSGTIHGTCLADNVPLNPLNISFINFGAVLLNKIQSGLIFIQDFHNYNKLTISNLLPSKNYNCLVISDSNIQLTEFINIDFTKFDEVVIAKSNVTNILLSNSLFPSVVNLETKHPLLGFKIDPINSITADTYKRENYRQLRIAMESQGNRRAALVYKAKEMHYLRRELSFGWNKILLYANFLSNNHGIGWARGIAFTITCCFFFFIVYELTLDAPIFYFNRGASPSQTKEAFILGLNGFLKYLASFPSLRLEGDSDNWATNLVVILSRIFVGYGIYQTIVAFRKFGSK